MAAREVMVVTPAIAAIIREAKTHQIYSAIQTGSNHGMCTMEKALGRTVPRGEHAPRKMLSARRTIPRSSGRCSPGRTLKSMTHPA